MGAFFGFFFGDKDIVLIKEIAKLHKVSVEVVEKHYKEMLEKIKDDELQK